MKNLLVDSAISKYKNVIAYFLVVALSILLLLRGVVPAWQSVHSDFANYYVSAKLVAAHEPMDSLYNNEWFQQRIRDYGISTPGKFSPFPPLTAWVMLPLTSLGPLTAQRAFTIVNFLFLLGGIVVIRQLTAWGWVYCSLVLLAGGLGTINNFAFGQVYLIMTVLLLFAFQQHARNKMLAPGIIIGFFTAFKYFPALILAGFLLAGFAELKLKGARLDDIIRNNYLRVVLFAGITLLFLGLTQYFFFGPKILTDYFFSAFLPHLDGVLHGQGLYSLQFQSWDSLLRTIFLFDENFNPHPFIDWPVGKVALKSMITLLVCLTTFLSLKNVNSTDSSQKSRIYVSVLSLAGLVLLPASATYHFILLAIPLVFLIHSNLLSKATVTLMLVIYFSIGLIPYGTAFRLSESWGIFFGYPRLWLVTLLFFVISFDLVKSKTRPYAK